MVATCYMVINLWQVILIFPKRAATVSPISGLSSHWRSWDFPSRMGSVFLSPWIWVGLWLWWGHAMWLSRLGYKRQYGFLWISRDTHSGNSATILWGSPSHVENCGSVSWLTATRHAVRKLWGDPYPHHHLASTIWAILNKSHSAELVKSRTMRMIMKSLLSHNLRGDLYSNRYLFFWYPDRISGKRFY